MLTLNSTLAAHLAEPIHNPAVAVTIDDRFCGDLRPRWTLFATDTVPEGPHYMCATYDTAFIRARVDTTTHTLYTQRITDPTIVAQWKAWASAATSVSPSAQIALAWDGNTIQAIIFIADDNRTIKIIQSTDNGATWSAAATVTTLASGHTCTAIAATLNSGLGTLILIYADHTTAAHTTDIYTATRAEAGGAWSTPAKWDRLPVATIYSLAVDGVGDELRVICAQDNGLVYYAVPSDALTTWPTPANIIAAHDTTTSFDYLSIAYAFNQQYHYFFTESNTTLNYTRLQHITTSSGVMDIIVNQPRPYNITAYYGVHTVPDLTYHYLVTAAQIYRAKRWTAAAGEQRATVTNDVMALKIEEHLDQPGKLTLTLRNDDGRYATDLTAGTTQPIRQRSQINPSLGYTISGAALTQMHRPFYITNIRHNRKRRRSHLIITATDGWGVLAATRTDRVLTWTNKTIRQLLDAIVASHATQLTDDANAVWDTVIPTFTIPPGAALIGHVKSLLALAGGQLIFKPIADDAWNAAPAYIFVPSATSSYTYGDAHTIIEASYHTNHPRHNRATAAGDEIGREALDWTEIENDNAAETANVTDARLTSAAQLTTLATSLLEDAQAAKRNAAITIQPHPGQEPGDAVTVQDDIIALDQAYQVAAITTEYDTTLGTYQQTLTLTTPPT